MSEITIEKIAKTVEAVVKQELEPIKIELADVKLVQAKHSTQLDGIAKDVKTLMENKTVANHRLDRLETWGVKVGEKVEIRLEV